MEARRLLSLDLDGELSNETAFALARHLDTCTVCAERFAAERKLEGGLQRALLPPVEPDAALWHVIEQRLRRARRRPTLPVMAFACATVIVAVLAAMFWVARAEPSDSLQAALAAMHKKVLHGTEMPQAEFDGAGAAASFFRDRLAFPVHVGNGVDVRGGRVCAVRGCKLALLFARDAGQPVSVFTIPQELLEMYPDEARELRENGCVVTQYGSVTIVLEHRRHLVHAAAGELPAGHLRGVLGSGH